MAYDPDYHVADPVTGMLRHKDTGHLIGIEQVPSGRPELIDPAEWPKWVEVHRSHHVHQGMDNIVVYGFERYHVARDGRVTVLCLDQADEHRALAEKEGAAQANPEMPSPAPSDQIEREQAGGQRPMLAGEGEEGPSSPSFARPEPTPAKIDGVA